MTTTWIDELTARYGEPRLAYPDPVDLGDRKRRCWVWFVNGENHNLAIDLTLDTWPWTVRAGATGRQVRLTMAAEPDDATIRQVLVLAGML